MGACGQSAGSCCGGIGEGDRRGLADDCGSVATDDGGLFAEHRGLEGLEGAASERIVECGVTAAALLSGLDRIVGHRSGEAESDVRGEERLHRDGRNRTDAALSHAGGQVGRVQCGECLPVDASPEAAGLARDFVPLRGQDRDQALGRDFEVVPVVQAGSAEPLRGGGCLGKFVGDYRRTRQRIADRRERCLIGCSVHRRLLLSLGGGLLDLEKCQPFSERGLEDRVLSRGGHLREDGLFVVAIL